MRLLPRGRALIRRDRRIALDQPDAVQGDADFLCHQLHLRGVEPLTEIALSRVSRDAAVAPDRDPRIELGTAGSVEALGEHVAQAIDDSGRRESDDERAGALEERTPGQSCADQRAPGIARKL
jgi:hypothetical protein